MILLYPFIKRILNLIFFLCVQAISYKHSHRSHNRLIAVSLKTGDFNTTTTTTKPLIPNKKQAISITEQIYSSRRRKMRTKTGKQQT
jgi:nucleotidyltransferase/DNA polymerase involved in DNA repair